MRTLRRAQFTIQKRRTERHVRNAAAAATSPNATSPSSDSWLPHREHPGMQLRLQTCQLDSRQI